MWKRDLAWRLGGLVPLGMFVGTSLAHQSVLAAARHGPATAAESILGLLSFTLASLGVLLLIYGPRLRDEWRRDFARPDLKGNGDPAPPIAAAQRDAAFIDFYLPAAASRRTVGQVVAPATRPAPDGP